MKLRVCTAALVAAILAWPSAAGAAVRDTSVPNNFVSGYIGFNSNSNTDIRQSGTPSLIGKTGTSYTLNYRNMKMDSGVWGGMGFGHWFKQVPVSVGVSGTMDFFNAAVKEQTTRDNTLTVDGVLQPQATFTKYRTDIFQIVPAVNLIVGVPLKFFRVYGGVGPGLFMSIYDFTLKGTNTTSHVTAFDTKIGYNAFFGADFFISKHVSAFVEGKYSQVDGLTFTPAPSQIGGRNLTERYNSLKTQRVAVGASYHF